MPTKVEPYCKTCCPDDDLTLVVRTCPDNQSATGFILTRAGQLARVVQFLGFLRALVSVIQERPCARDQEEPEWPPAHDEEELDELKRENAELLQAISDAKEQLQSDSAQLVGPGTCGASGDAIPFAEPASGHEKVAAFCQDFGDRDEIIQQLLSHRKARAGRRTMANTHP